MLPKNFRRQRRTFFLVWLDHKLQSLLVFIANRLGVMVGPPIYREWYGHRVETWTIPANWPSVKTPTWYLDVLFQLTHAFTSQILYNKKKSESGSELFWMLVFLENKKITTTRVMTDVFNTRTGYTKWQLLSSKKKGVSWRFTCMLNQLTNWNRFSPCNSTCLQSYTQWKSWEFL